MMAPRETIWATFFGLLSGAANFNTIGRIPLSWSALQPDQFPAMYMVQKKESITSTGIRMPRKHVLSGDIYLYVYSGDPLASPASLMNPIVDAVEKLIYPPQPVLVQQKLVTQGYPLGLIQEARIVGDIETDEGTLGQKAVSIIPFELIATD